MLDCRLDPTHHRTTGRSPLPWLPGIPRQLRENTQWKDYLTGRAEQISTLAAEIREQAAGWTPGTAPPWAAALLDADPTLVGDLAAWRAALAVDPTDTSPVRPAPATAAEARAHQQLTDRAAAVLGRPGQAATRWARSPPASTPGSPPTRTGRSSPTGSPPPAAPDSTSPPLPLRSPPTRHYPTSSPPPPSGGGSPATYPPPRCTPAPPTPPPPCAQPGPRYSPPCSPTPQPTGLSTTRPGPPWSPPSPTRRAARLDARPDPGHRPRPTRHRTPRQRAVAARRNRRRTRLAHQRAHRPFPPLPRKHPSPAQPSNRHPTTPRPHQHPRHRPRRRRRAARPRRRLGSQPATPRRHPRGTPQHTDIPDTTRHQQRQTGRREVRAVTWVRRSGE